VTIRKSEIVAALYASRGLPEVQMMVELLEMHLAASKTALVTAPADQVAMEQGRARAYDALLKALTRPTSIAHTSET
jgi:hypothetical protein